MKPRAKQTPKPANRGSATASRGSRHRRADAVFDAAARVFAERGYFGASTQDIADVLNIKQASLYYYFSSKEMALEEVCTRAVGNFIEAAQAIADSDVSAVEKIDQLVHSHLRPLNTRSDYAQVLLKERRYLPAKTRRQIGILTRRLEGIFEAVVKDGVRTGEFRSDLDPRLTTFALLGMLNAVASWYRVGVDPDVEVISDAFSRVALEGVAAKSTEQ